MKKIIYKIDTELKAIQDEQSTQKEQAFKELKEYVTKHIDFKDEELEFNPVNLFKERFADKYSTKFPDFVTIEKMIELAEISLHKIDSLFERYSAIKVDTSDCNIYLTSEEQVNRLKLVNDLIKSIEAVQENANGHTIYLGTLIQAFNTILTFNHVTQKIEPNDLFIIR